MFEKNTFTFGVSIAVKHIETITKNPSNLARLLFRGIFSCYAFLQKIDYEFMARNSDFLSF